jgi:hypothetical protein
MTPNTPVKPPWEASSSPSVNSRRFRICTNTLAVLVCIALVFLEINIGIAGISFVMWIVVHSAYSDKITNLRKEMISRLDTKALDLMKELGQQWTPDSRKRLSELLAEYSEVDQPRAWLKQGTNLFLYSAVIAALGILSNLATAIPGLETFGLMEGPFAFFAIVFLIWGAYHTYQVVTFLSSPEEDPELPPLYTIFVVAVLQFADAFFLHMIFPSFDAVASWTRFTLWGKTLVGTLALSLLVGFVLILRWGKLSLKEVALELVAFASPWIVLVMGILLFVLHMPII